MGQSLDETALIVAQGIDRVESRRLGCGPHTEDQADGHGDGLPAGWPRRGHRRASWIRRSPAARPRNNDQDGEQASDRRQRHGLEEELPGDVAASRADRFSHADLARRSVTLTSMMFITPTPPISRPIELSTATTSATAPMMEWNCSPAATASVWRTSPAGCTSRSFAAATLRGPRLLSIQFARPRQHAYPCS